jgi:dihydrofolate reductase
VGHELAFGDDPDRSVSARPARGILDELQLHLIPVLLGDGIRLFEDLGPSDPQPSRS